MVKTTEVYDEKIDISSLDNIEELNETEVSEKEVSEKEMYIPEMSETSLDYYMARISGSTPLSREEEYELGKKIQQGDNEAYSKLVQANLKFVIKIANRFKNSGLPMMDIINQGNLGLLEAAKRFDPERGFKFISYAVWWIRQYIVLGIAEQSGTVRLPIKQAGNLFKINATRQRLIHDLGREPSYEELAEELDMKASDIEDILRVSRQSLSLENSIKDGESKTFLDNLVSKEESIEDNLIKKNLQDILHNIIEELDPREKEIISMRFGLEDDTFFTLEEIGKKFGVSRERIRQLETRALDKLRKKATKKGLQYYLAS